MRLSRKHKKFFVPMASMSDVAFLLLIFIMLVSLINYRRVVKIEYPEAETAKKVSVEKNFEIWVNKSGDIFLDGKLSSLSLVEQAIVEAYRKAPDTRIHIIADRNTPFENVHKILDILQLLEYRVVSFVVKNEQ